ncbi:MAG: lambda exonuclease family protein [Candidatus Eisenbacteria bacterium]
MRVLDVVQGSPEWLEARLGIPTASRFDSIMTPKTLKASASQDKYMCTLLAERLLGFPADEVMTDWMQRGIELEPEAASAYEFERDVDAAKVGFVLSDCGRYGASPDRLVGKDGLLEIKCPSAGVHVAALLGKGLDDYYYQCQGQLWVTGREWVDLMFYNPSLPRAIVRYARDVKYIAAMSQFVLEFCDRLDVAHAQLLELSGGPAPGAPALSIHRDTEAPTEGRAPGQSGPVAATDGASVSVVRTLDDVTRARVRTALRNYDATTAHIATRTEPIDTLNDAQLIEAATRLIPNVIAGL